jgi:hypothetical protein
VVDSGTNPERAVCLVRQCSERKSKGAKTNLELDVKTGDRTERNINKQEKTSRKTTEAYLGTIFGHELGRGMQWKRLHTYTYTHRVAT